MNLTTKIRLASVILLLSFNLLWYIVLRSQESSNPDYQLDEPTSSEKIVIGMVSCVGGFHDVGRKINEIKTLDTYSEEPLTLIKSILISAKISNAKHIEIHMFTDSLKYTDILKKGIQAYNTILSEFVKLKIYFHGVFRSVPSGYERDFIDNIRRCGYVRLFFPQSLPPEIKEILYLDTDTIITGNIKEIWNNFKERVVHTNNFERPTQLAAMIPNSEPGDGYPQTYEALFASIPHVPPCGVNSGVIFMNLDAMRKFNWSEKVIQIFSERRDRIQGDQQLFNIMFHDYLDRLTIFPCQYNFMHVHCEKGLTCKTIVTDPGGIQIMHGSDDTFQKLGRSHGHLFEAMKLFELEHHEDVERSLFEPLRKFYGGLIPSSNGMKTCFGTIGKYLFKTAKTEEEIQFGNKNISNIN